MSTAATMRLRQDSDRSMARPNRIVSSRSPRSRSNEAAPPASNVETARLKKMQHAAMERIVSVGLFSACLPLIIIIPIQLATDDVTRNQVIPFLAFFAMLLVTSLSNATFNLDEALRHRPATSCVITVLMGVLSTLPLGGIAGDYGRVLLLPTVFAAIALLNGPLFDGFWSFFWRKFSRRYVKGSQPGPGSVATFISVWLVIVTGAISVVLLLQYDDNRDGRQGAGLHPSRLGSAITTGIGAVAMTQQIIFEGRLRDGAAPRAPTKTQSALNTLVVAVVTFALNSLVQGVWPGECDLEAGGWCNPTVVVIDVLQITLAVCLLLFRGHVGGALSSLGRGRAKRHAATLLRELYAPSIDPGTYLSTGMSKFVAAQLSSQTSAGPVPVDEATGAASASANEWHVGGERVASALFTVAPASFGSVDYFVVSTSLSDLGVRSRLEELSWRFRNEHGRFPRLWIHDLCNANPSAARNNGGAYLPVFAAACQRAVILISSTLLKQPIAVLELFVAMAVHCEPERIFLEVLPDVGSVFSDSLVERIDNFDVDNILLSLDQLDGDALAVLQDVVNCHGGSDPFSHDLREFRFVLEHHRENLRKRLRGQPQDFADIVKSVMRGSIVSPENLVSTEAATGRSAVICVVFFGLWSIEKDERAIGVFEAEVSELVLLLCEGSGLVVNIVATAHVKALQVSLTVTLDVLPPSPSWAEDLTNELAGMAASNRLVVGTFPASDVFLAVAHRVPREISRKRIEKLNSIGVGNKSEIFKARVRGEEDGMPYYLVAVKTNEGGFNEVAREKLLEEAALMALLDHQNVLTLVGVVTAPRNLPAWLLLEYCENGSLLSFVQRKGPTISVSAKLSLCMDVCRGMKYLSARRIIHRNLAARNVLLDSALQCKIADFGQSTVEPLQGEEGEGVDERSNMHDTYIKLRRDDLPVRWAAVEVLVDGTFSSAADVWALGVVVYEVMSDGVVPYHSFSNVVDVSDHVVAGGRLDCPKACHHEVYKRLMEPCWAVDPIDRSTFTELFYTALELGGIEGPGDPVLDGGHDSSQSPAQRSETSRHVSNVASWLQAPATLLTDADDEAAAADTCIASNDPASDNVLLRGVSFGHLAGPFWQSVRKAVQPPYTGRHGMPLRSPDDATIHDAVAAYAKPLGAAAICPRDNERGAAYVDLLEVGCDAGPSDALLSYTWGYKVRTIIDALRSWAKSYRPEDWKRTYIWICALCLNQHRMQTKWVEPGDLALEFRTRVEGIGRILPLLAPWSAPLYVGRIWCLFELYTAIRNRHTVNIDIILGANERDSLQQAVAMDGFQAIDRALEHISSRQATASRQSDLDAISKLVLGMPGGFRTLDDTVRSHLRWWFDQCGIQVAPLRLRQMRQTIRRSVRASKRNRKSGRAGEKSFDADGATRVPSGAADIAHKDGLGATTSTGVSEKGARRVRLSGNPEAIERLKAAAASAAAAAAAEASAAAATPAAITAEAPSLYSGCSSVPRNTSTESIGSRHRLRLVDMSSASGPAAAAATPSAPRTAQGRPLSRVAEDTLSSAVKSATNGQCPHNLATAEYDPPVARIRHQQQRRPEASSRASLEDSLSMSKSEGSRIEPTASLAAHSGPPTIFLHGTELTITYI